MNYKKSQNSSTGSNILLFQIIFVVVVVAGVLFLDSFWNAWPLGFDRGSKDKAILLIDFANMTRMFEGEVADKMTILDALNASVAAGEIKFHYVVDRENNTTVTEINDHAATGDKNFSFYVNEANINIQDLNKITIRPGDKITIRLE